MSRKLVLVSLLALSAGVLCMAQPVPCMPEPSSWYPNLIVNGGFEDTSMGLTGWKVMDQHEWTDCEEMAATHASSAYETHSKSEVLPPTGCWGSWYPQSGFSSPWSGQPVPPPPQCQYAAMTDMNSPGTHVMYQDITVPALGAMLSFWYFFPGGFDGPLGVPPVGPPTDYFRVDLMSLGADPFDVGPGVIQNLLTRVRLGPPPPAPGSATGPETSIGFGYMPFSTSLSAYAGQKVRLRFMESDHQGILTVGVDDVQLRGEGFNQVFWDDGKLVALCIDSYTGAFHWNIRSCKTECPWTNWSGVAQVVNTGTLYTSHPTDPFAMYFLYDVLRHKANGYFYTSQPLCNLVPTVASRSEAAIYSKLLDTNTLKGPNYCPEGCMYGNN